MYKAYLSLGSNLGNRIDNIVKAIQELSRLEKFVVIKKKSSFYETEPFGFKDQPFFINITIEIETTFEPIFLLKVCKEIEFLLGRKFRERMHEREIDMDILFFNNKTIEAKDLNIPHRELYNRRFVLEPLNEIASDFICPKTNKSVFTLLSECLDNSSVKRITN